ncbi:MAG TPA: hypothetical protein VHS78_15480 [Candidatus Elarobacter sp.]|jgi:hypothetical protein|nr:hypothetical protein [Candidatus Elarobacter sp.]
MTDLEVLRSRVPGYAGYANDAARHEVDKQIRAFLGEALAAARDRLRPEGALAERLDGLLMRCEFSDQRVIRAADHARFDQPVVAHIQSLDRALVECADRIRAVTTQEQLATELDAAARCLDERFGAVIDAPPR